MPDFKTVEQTVRYLDENCAPFGLFAPGLVYAYPDHAQEVLATGEFVGFQDYRDACDALQINIGEGMKAFGATIRFLGRNRGDKFTEKVHQSMTLANHPEVMRCRYLVATQAIADLIMCQEIPKDKSGINYFKPTHWNVLHAVIEDPSWFNCGSCAVTDYLFDQGKIEPNQKWGMTITPKKLDKFPD